MTLAGGRDTKLRLIILLVVCLPLGGRRRVGRHSFTVCYSVASQRGDCSITVKRAAMKGHHGSAATVEAYAVVRWSWWTASPVADGAEPMLPDCYEHHGSG